MFTNDKQDDVEMLRQLRLLYMQSNKIIRMFYFCKYHYKNCVKVYNQDPNVEHSAFKMQ